VSAGDTIWGIPAQDQGIAEQVSGDNSDGWLLIASAATTGTNVYNFDLYAGPDQSMLVGTAQVQVGDCAASVDSSSTVSWSVAGSNGICVVQDTAMEIVHVSNTRPADSSTFERSCCNANEDCFIGIQTAVGNAACGDCSF